MKHLILATIVAGALSFVTSCSEDTSPEELMKITFKELREREQEVKDDFYEISAAFNRGEITADEAAKELLKIAPEYRIVNKAKKLQSEEIEKLIKNKDFEKWNEKMQAAHQDLK